MNARLLVTYDCPNHCALCCNKDKSGPKPEVVADIAAFKGLGMVLITGGEPLLYPYRLLDLIHELRRATKAKIIVYTAMAALHDTLEAIIHAADGITVTLHTQDDACDFFKFGNVKLPRNKSLRMNVFKGVQPPPMPKRWFMQREMIWMPHCPIPKGEVFWRLKNLWSQP